MRDASAALRGIEDTIVAISTARAPAARGVIRLSGDRAFAVAESCLRVRSGERSLASLRWGVRRAIFVFEGRGVGAPALVLGMRGPRSFTGEDLVEVHLPGAPVLLDLALDALLRAGARPAEAGEFTRRAFVHGRIDLAQAEAVAALVHAADEEERRAAMALLAEGAGRDLRDLASDIVELLVPLELELDFSDQDIEILPPRRLLADLEGLLARCARAADREAGEGRGEGRPRILLAGPANAGKSALFNRLGGEELALVTDRAGTTRDYLEVEIQIEGEPVVLVDSAGRDHEGGAADRAAHRLRDREAARADLVVEVRDGTAAAPASDLVLTRADLVPAARRGPGRWVSSRTGEGLDDLRSALALALAERRRGSGAALAEHARRREAALREAREALGRAREAAAGELGPELVAADLHEALRALRALTGEELDSALLDRIMARFCIGK
ncbi:MAG: GTPase [Planctomycetota bacterium]